MSTCRLPWPRDCVSTTLRVTTSVEAGLLGAGDETQLEFSATRGSVIVTHDEDFLRCHALSANQAGIVYCHQDEYSVGELLELLSLRHACYTSDETAGRLEYL